MWCKKLSARARMATYSKHGLEATYYLLSKLSSWENGLSVASRRIYKPRPIE